MSFSFRNLFSQDESENSGKADPSREKTNDSGRASFLPDGTTSPFQGNRSGEQPRGGESRRSYTRYMVSELLPFVPPAIAAPSGIPMEQMMEIPLPADGSRDVKLSTLYQLCPNLFASEITPLNDSVITLPPKIEEMSSNQAEADRRTSAAPGGGQINPFSDAGMQAQGETAPASGGGAGAFSQNPFWSPGPEEEASTKDESNPFSPSSGASPMPGNSSFGEPPGPAPGTGDQASRNHSGPQPAAGFLPPVAGDAGKPEEGTGFSQSPQTDYSTGEAGGQPAPGNPYSDSNSPDFGAQSAFPGSIPPKDEFSTMFSRKADEDQFIEPPGMSSPSGMDPANSWNTQSPGPNERDSHAPASYSAAEGNTGQSPFEGTMDAIESAAEDDDEFEGYLPPAADENTLSQIPGLAESESAREEAGAGFGDEPVHFDDLMASIDERESNPDLGSGRSSFFDELANAPVVSGNPIDSESFGEKGGAESPFKAEAPAETPANTNTGESEAFSQEAKPVAPVFSSSGKTRDLELRAVFGIEESFTLQKVADLICGMGGVSYCAISSPAGSARSGRSNGETSSESIREMSRSVRQLAEFSGISDASMFSLQTDQGMVSLFLEGQSCLMVRNENSGFGPGVRERLILVARSLDRIES